MCEDHECQLERIADALESIDHWQRLTPAERRAERERRIAEDRQAKREAVALCKRVLATRQDELG